MFLGFLTIVMMLIVAYAFLQEGVMTAFMMMCNVFISGLVAFNYWEPLANGLEPVFTGSFLQGYEDAFCLVFLFSLTLLLLRTVTNQLSFTLVSYKLYLHQGGAVLCGLLTGYLVAGFLLCVVQTLPLPRDFMEFEPGINLKEEVPGRRILPPDRVWLALMHRGSMGPFSHSPPVPFDRDGSFELRYARQRRSGEGGK